MSAFPCDRVLCLLLGDFPLRLVFPGLSCLSVVSVVCVAMGGVFLPPILLPKVTFVIGVVVWMVTALLGAVTNSFHSFCIVTH